MSNYKIGLQEKIIMTLILHELIRECHKQWQKLRWAHRLISN